MLRYEKPELKVLHKQNTDETGTNNYGCDHCGGIADQSAAQVETYILKFWG